MHQIISYDTAMGNNHDDPNLTEPQNRVFSLAEATLLFIVRCMLNLVQRINKYG
jgi:hypothetical protein